MPVNAPSIMVPSNITSGRIPSKITELITGVDTTPFDPPVGSSAVTNAPATTPTDLDDDNFFTYLEGLLSSVGEEHKKNRDYNTTEARLNREFQAEEAAKQRAWYTSLSNSAYSRSMADMKSAGLNPILAYQNGGAAAASTGVPTGSAASYNSANGDSLSTLLSAAADLIASFMGNAKTSGKLNDILKLLNK